MRPYASKHFKTLLQINRNRKVSNFSWIFFSMVLKNYVWFFGGKFWNWNFNDFFFFIFVNVSWGVMECEFQNATPTNRSRKFSYPQWIFPSMIRTKLLGIFLNFDFPIFSDFFPKISNLPLYHYSETKTLRYQWNEALHGEMDWNLGLRVIVEHILVPLTF